MVHVYREGDEPVPGAGYRLLSYLGRGGFGEVWKASTPGGGEAAVKIIRLGGAEGRKEFRALQLVKRIRHPNLMPLMAFWLKSSGGALLDDAVAEQAELVASAAAEPSLDKTSMPPLAQSLPPAELVIVMGLGDTPLIERLQQCKADGLPGIPVDELLGYMEDTAEALDFLNRPIHECGSGPVAIQHCDVKPHNLMIVGGGVQVCDFGLARMMGVERVTTGAASIAYAAPELLDGNRISSTTDQYSLAVTYFELRTGRLPYAEETVAAVLDAKRKETLDFSACLPAEQDVLRRATSCDPNPPVRLVPGNGPGPAPGGCGRIDRCNRGTFARRRPAPFLEGDRRSGPPGVAGGRGGTGRLVAFRARTGGPESRRQDDRRRRWQFGQSRGRGTTRPCHRTDEERCNARRSDQGTSEGRRGVAKRLPALESPGPCVAAKAAVR